MPAFLESAYNLKYAQLGDQERNCGLGVNTSIRLCGGAVTQLESSAKMNSPGLDALPLDILATIFCRYMGLTKAFYCGTGRPDLVDVVSAIAAFRAVCRTFRRVADDGPFSVTRVSYGAYAAMASATTPKKPHVHIEVYDVPRSAHDLAVCVPQTAVTFSYLVDSMWRPPVQFAVPKGTSLVSLSVYGCLPGDVLQQLARARALRRLKFYEVQGLVAPGADKAFPALGYLELDGHGTNFGAIRALCQQSPQLHTARIDNMTWLSEWGVSPFFMMPKTIRKVVLVRCYVQRSNPVAPKGNVHELVLSGVEPASVYSLLQAIKSVEELSVTLSRDVLELGFLSRYPQLKVLNLFQKYVFTFSVLAVLPEGLRVNLECWDQVWFDEGDLAYMRRGQRLCLKGQQIRNLHEIVRTCSIEMLPEGASLELWRFNAEGGEDLVFSLYRENMEGGQPQPRMVFMQ